MQDIIALGYYALIALVILLFVAALASYFDNSFRGTIAPQIEASANLNLSEAKAMSSTMEQATDNFDYIVPLMVFAGAIVALALAWQIPVSPIFLPISVLFLLFAGISGWLAQQVGTQVLDTAETSLGVTFPLTKLLFANWLIITIVYGGLMLIATYAKPRG